MENNKSRVYDKPIAVIFSLLIVVFLILAFTNQSFFSWAYGRHQNQLSWYIRPLFLIPFCYFAYKRSWSGIWGTILLLLTSMFWFPKPSVVTESVKEFLQMEIEYLSGGWDLSKILMTLLIPASFWALGAAFWKRSLKTGLLVIAFMAIAKIIWSIIFGGDSGKSILAPAIMGLVICIILVYWGFKKLERK